MRSVTGSHGAGEAFERRPDNDIRERLEDVVRTLAAIERPSASDGERGAAEAVVARLRGAGARDARIEDEPAHGGYWLPLALANAAALAAHAWAARRPRSLVRRGVAALAGAVTAAAVWDDVSGGRLWWRRALLPHRRTWNVVAEAGDAAAERTIALVAHHDAAHTGLIFHPALSRAGMRLLPRLHERSTQTVPVIWGVFIGPVLTAAAALTRSRRGRTLAPLFCVGAAAAMADIGARRSVPGANDNLCAVAVLVELARALAQDPPAGVRVMLVSTGAEESFSEGMHGFLRRHGDSLPRAATEVVCLECVGSPHLQVLEGEGMLRMRRYDEHIRERLADAARRANEPIGRGLKTVAATDALPALRRGYRTATLCAIAETKWPANYHWPSDTPENVAWATVEAALRVCEQYVRGR